MTDRHLAGDSHRIETLVLDRARTHTPPQHPRTRLFLANPRAPGPVGVLYMLDGNAAFDALSRDLLAAHPRLAIVGVGYDTPGRFARMVRGFDYTPPPERADPHVPGQRAGGAAAHLARLLGPVRAVAESRLLADPARRSLWGHSFGALFALYTLATRPEAFARYAAISPSVWWDAPLVNGLADQIRGGGQRLLLAVGDAEKHRGTPNAGAQTPAGPPPATMALGRRLAAVPGLEVTRAVYPGAAHIDSLTASLPQTLALAAQ